MGEVVYQKPSGSPIRGVNGAGPPVGPIGDLLRVPSEFHRPRSVWRASTERVLPCYTGSMQIGPLAIYPSVRRWRVARRFGLTLRFSLIWKSR